ncbi:MAG: hypothetical protein E2O39_13650 [Planctomycetota bacterium]|nr:MAG: hypothetical protein E2O39_13650 [Planctomycetota bacterium]
MRTVLSLALAMLGCASPASHTAPVVGQPAEVRFYDSRTGLHMAIVNDSHLARLGVQGGNPNDRRVAFYSETSNEAGPKVITDEMLAGLINYLDEAGFERLAVAGPIAEGESGSVSLEITTGPAVRHAVRHRGMSAKDAKSFNELVMAFYQTYNAIPQYQAYTRQSAEKIFQSPDSHRAPGRN